MLEKIGTPGFETLSAADETVCENVAALVADGRAIPWSPRSASGSAPPHGSSRASWTRGGLHLYDFHAKLAEL